MRVVRAGEPPAAKGPPQQFTGTAWGETSIEASDSMPLVVGRVAFTPGARTAWHTHPRGQILLVVAGVGRVQCCGEEVFELRPGDTVAIEPGEDHWHGASENHPFEHLEVHGVADDGGGADWGELVTDADQEGSSRRSAHSVLGDTVGVWPDADAGTSSWFVTIRSTASAAFALARSERACPSQEKLLAPEESSGTPLAFSASIIR